MRLPVRTTPVTLLLSCALLVPALTPAARGVQQPATRPRRVEPLPKEVETAAPRAPAGAPETNALRGEPVVRVGLASNARSVNISTDGRLLYSTDESSPASPLEVARVRVEARSLAPLTTPSPTVDDFADEIAGINESPSINESLSPSLNPNVKTTVRAPSDAPVSNAQSKAAPRPVWGGARDESPTPKAGASEGRGGGVRLASRVSEATRGAVAYVPWSTTPLFDARAPVVFASDDEAQHPVKFNERPYRGRLEVFANRRGTLTIVNVVGLEEYVRGVVPNELSPGGYPELEALKAQAVAARTYAVSNRGRFAAEGFDLLPTTRSQVYGGRATEHPLTDRAVAETRGRVLTFKGEPINALYTSTCGGHTEDGENIFGGERIPYLRGRACAVEAGDGFEPYTLRTSRDLPAVERAEHAASAREAALLAAHGFRVPARLTDEWLAAAVAADEARALFEGVAALARQPAPVLSQDATRPAGFSTALSLALDGESRADTLLSQADVEYLLAFRDAGEVPAGSRADVALLLREGHLTLYADATLRPRQPMSRARALHAVAHALEARQLLRLQKATARPSGGGALLLRPAGKVGADRKLYVSPGAYLFRAYGEALFQVREVAIVGGEAVTFHTDARGEIDYLEVLPSAKGAAADRFSPYALWAETLTPQEALSRLRRSVGDIGPLVDLRVRARGSSRRVLDLEVVGADRTAHVRGGRVRSALGLREQLFVIERRYDESGRVKSFTFTGRGWGHGVGMCQVGAYGLARSGWSHEKILKAYYSGVNLTKLY